MDDGGSDDGDGDNIFRWVQSSELLSLGRQSLLSVSFKGLALKQSPGQTEVRVQSWPCPCKPHWWILGRCRWFALGQEDDWKRDSQPRERAWTHTHRHTSMEADETDRHMRFMSDMKCDEKQITWRTEQWVRDEWLCLKIETCPTVNFWSRTP